MAKMALITRSFASFGTTVEVSYTFDDVTGALISVNARNDDVKPATFRLVHPVLGTWERDIPPGSNQSFTPPVSVALASIVTARGPRLFFPGRFEFVGPH